MSVWVLEVWSSDWGFYLGFFLGGLGVGVLGWVVQVWGFLIRVGVSVRVLDWGFAIEGLRLGVQRLGFF